MPVKQVDLTKIPRLDRGLAGEVNFVGEKLQKLSQRKLAELHRALHGDQLSKEFGKAVVLLLKLIMDAPDDELLIYMNKVFGFKFHGYVFTDPQTKAYLFTAFFFNHLVPPSKKGGKKYRVGVVDLKTLKVRLPK